MRPMSFDALSIRSTDVRENVEREFGVSWAVNAEMFLGDAVSDWGFLEIDAHVVGEGEHSLPEILVPLAGYIVTDEQR